jgi:hypothetical protein
MSTLKFPIRLNLDGWFDSICPICFATIGPTESDTQLREAEAKHVCNPVMPSYQKKKVVPIR